MEKDDLSSPSGPAYPAYIDSSPEPSTDSGSSGRAGDSTPSEIPGISLGENVGDDTQRQRKRHRVDSDVGSSTVTTPPPSGEGSSPLSLPTHDLSNVSYHLPNIDVTAKQILAAATEAWDRRFRYNNVFALLMYWEDDDLNVAPEVAALEATLSQVYHYEVETWKITTKRPCWQLTTRLIEFLTLNDAKGNLVLFYYAGHAMANPQSGGAPLWTPRRTQGETMFSGSILSIVEEAKSDFLLLFDCCHAYHPPSRPSGSGRNIIEVISAVGFGAIAAEPGTDSFTHHLDEALALAVRNGPINAVDLHMNIIRRLFPQAPRRLRREHSFVVDQSGPVEEKSPRRCPLHYWLSGQPKTITLAPLKPSSSIPKAQGASSDGPPKVLRDPSSEGAIDTSGDLAGTGIIQIQQARFPQVLVCFRVTRDALDPATWVKWLLEAPAEARDLVKIEGFYGSFSSLLLIRMPIQVWDLLPGSPAVSFVGFVTTSNEGPRLQEEVDSLLSKDKQPAPTEKVAETMGDVKGTSQRKNLDIENDQAITNTPLVLPRYLNRLASREPYFLPPLILSGSSPEDPRTNVMKYHGNDGMGVEHRGDKIAGTSYAAQDQSLSCPFRKRNPVKFNVRDHLSCATQSFPDISQLKRHIKLFHKQKAVLKLFDCPRCKRSIGSKDFQDHLAVDNDKTCPPQEISSSQDPEDGISAKLEDILNGRRSNTKVDTWEILWQTLFPNDPRETMPDPVFVPPVELDEAYDFHAQQCREDLRRRISDEEQRAAGSYRDIDGHVDRMVEICEEYIQDVFRGCRECKIGNLPGPTWRKRVPDPKLEGLRGQKYLAHSDIPPSMAGQSSFVSMNDDLSSASFTDGASTTSSPALTRAPSPMFPEFPELFTNARSTSSPAPRDDLSPAGFGGDFLSPSPAGFDGTPMFPALNTPVSGGGYQAGHRGGFNGGGGMGFYGGAGDSMVPFATSMHPHPLPSQQGLGEDMVPTTTLHGDFLRAGGVGGREASTANSQVDMDQLDPQLFGGLSPAQLHPHGWNPSGDSPWGF